MLILPLNYVSFLGLYFSTPFLQTKYLYQIMQKTLDYSILKSYNSFKNLNNNNESGVRKWLP